MPFFQKHREIAINVIKQVVDLIILEQLNNSLG